LAYGNISHVRVSTIFGLIPKIPGLNELNPRFRDWKNARDPGINSLTVTARATHARRTEPQTNNKDLLLAQYNKGFVILCYWSED